MSSITRSSKKLISVDEFDGTDIARDSDLASHPPREQRGREQIPLPNLLSDMEQIHVRID
jgi:hypothetical protein